MLPDGDEVRLGDSRSAEGELWPGKLQGRAGPSRGVAWRRGGRRGPECFQKEDLAEILVVPLAQVRGEAWGWRRGVPVPCVAVI